MAEGKGGHQRVVPVSARFFAAVGAYLNLNGPHRAEAFGQYLEEVRPRYGPGSHPALWLTERGERISPRSVDERFAAWRAAAGCPASCRCTACGIRMSRI